MSATNSTANYELPIFLATDKPAWLTDWNGAMNAIDSAIHSAQSTADGAQTTAGTAIADIATINASLTTITGNITSLTTTVNGNTGSINTINSLIGNGQPTTEDKTLIGAINEIYAMITGGGDPIEADNVSYDNTTSGLTAVDVQSAIDEVYASIPGSVGYDFDLSAHTGTATITGTSVQSDSEVKYLLNQEKSIGKIYGGIRLSGLNLVQGVNVVANIAISDLKTIATAYDIKMGFVTTYGSTLVPDAFLPLTFKFKTDKSIDIILTAPTELSSQFANISLAPCVLFLENLGD